MLFVLPALLLFAAFRFVPAVSAVWLSLTDRGLDGAWRFVGMSNYRDLLADETMWASLRVTAVYVACYVPLTVLGALATALALLGLGRRGRRHGWFRTALVLPSLTATVTAAAGWRAMYEVEDGVLNNVLATLGTGSVDFLGEPHLVLPSLAVVSAWKGFGYSLLILLAGLLAVPRCCLEAARLDGASGWQQFRHVTLPVLRPVLLFVLVVETISALQVFDVVYVLTGGGPAGASHTLVYELYDTGFTFLDLGRASAMGVTFCVLTLALAATQWRLLRGRIS